MNPLSLYRIIKTTRNKRAIKICFMPQQPLKRVKSKVVFRTCYWPLSRPAYTRKAKFSNPLLLLSWIVCQMTLAYSFLAFTSSRITNWKEPQSFSTPPPLRCFLMANKTFLIGLHHYNTLQNFCNLKSLYMASLSGL